MQKIIDIKEIFNFTYKQDNEEVIFIIKDLGLKMNYKKIHVVGTNGKGTTCKFLSDNFSKNNISNGSFTSPHLLSPTERIKLNSKEISNNDLLEKINFILKKYQEKNFNFFSLMLLASLIFFEEKKPEIVIFEAGIGAKKDIVNILDFDFTIFTSISIDHQEILGNSINKISKDKSEAIKGKTKVYIPSNLNSISLQIILNKIKNNKNSFFLVPIPKKEKNIYLINFLVVEFFLKNELNIKAIMTSLSKGRLTKENINGKICYLDVSHNYDGIKKTLSLLPNKNVLFVISLTKRNDIEKIMNLFKNKNNIFIYENSSKKALKIEDYPKNFPIIENLNNFIKEINKIKETIIFLGSHYFVSDIYEIIKEGKNEK
ncbi:MAG: Mur ligase family protein [Metamycoplasmataceae bacterium]